MTVVWIDTPGSTLPSRFESLDFTTANDVAFVSISFGSIFPEECAYRDGAFLYPYLQSTCVGHTFSLVRRGGWPANPAPHVGETSLVVLPALTPTEQSPWAQWACDGVESDAATVSWDFTDRTGNGRGAGGASYRPVPDLRAGRMAAGPGSFGTCTGPYLPGDNTTINGALTLCGRAFLPNRAAGTFQPLISADGCRLMGITAAGYFASQHYQGSTNVSSLFVPSTMFGRWFWWSLRRSADRQTLRFQYETTFETISGASAGNPVYNRFNLGNNLSFSNELWLGGLADLSVWTTQLTDADMLRFRKISLGLP